MATREVRIAKELRLVETEKALAAGMSSMEIQLLFARQYDIALRTVRKDIFAIERKWAEEAESEGAAPLRRNQTRQLLKAIVRKAMAAKQFSAATAAVGRLMELDGMKVLKVEHSGDVKHTIEKMTSDEKRKKLDQYWELIQTRKSANGKADGSTLN